MAQTTPRDMVSTLRQALQGAPEALLAAYLFGSRARSDTVSGSDVDVAVLMADGEPRTLVGPESRLSGMLERTLRVPVDLVNLRTASPDLIHRVLRDGELILDRDPAARVRFEVRARNAYFDVLPHLKEYRGYRAA